MYNLGNKEACKAQNQVSTAIGSHSEKIEEEPIHAKKMKTELSKIVAIKEECKSHNLISSGMSTSSHEEIQYTYHKNGNTYPPTYWREMLENIRLMRQKQDAPVDSMGCHKCQDENASQIDQRYQKLLSLMLSSQTKDEVTYAAMQKLIKHGCNVDSILNISDEELSDLIYPVGFWKKKVVYIKKTTKILKEKYNGDIPNSLKELMGLSGVGPKMANLCMQSAWGKATGIGVDTHLHRICNRLGWVISTTPEQTQKQLEEWLPANLWQEVNQLLVGFGQQTCLPKKPNCQNCLINNLCPYGVDRLSLDF